MPHPDAQCTIAFSTSNKGTSSSLLRIPKKRTKAAKSKSEMGMSSGPNSQNSIPCRSIGMIGSGSSSANNSSFTEVTVFTRTSINANTSENLKETKQSGVLSFCHFLNVVNPTTDEIFFLLCVRGLGLKVATFLAAKFQMKCQRPLQALRAMMNARGRNYSVRNAKRKLPSGSSASSRKRSSGA